MKEEKGQEQAMLKEDFSAFLWTGKVIAALRLLTKVVFVIRDDYLCWLCADTSVGCVQTVMQLVLRNSSHQPIHHFWIQLSSALIDMLSLCQ